MAQTRQKIPLYDDKIFLILNPQNNLLANGSYSSSDELGLHKTLRAKLSSVYQVGAKTINRLPGLMEVYGELPRIKTESGRCKGKDPLQACFILKTGLDGLGLAAIVQVARSMLENMKDCVGNFVSPLPNQSLFLAEIAAYDIVYFYIQANKNLFLSYDLSFLKPTSFTEIGLSILGVHSMDSEKTLSAFSSIMIRGQYNLEAYLEFARLVYPVQMAKKKMPSEIAGQAPNISSQPSGLFVQPQASQKGEEKNSSLSL